MTFEQAVSGKRPLLRLVIRGAEGRQVTIDALVDTGFDGSLALPESLIATLALPDCYACPSRAPYAQPRSLPTGG